MTRSTIGPSRRAFLKQVGALAGSATLSELAFAAPAGAAHDVVETAAGKLRGQARNGCVRFLGIPFAQAPVGALRFASPRPAAPWTGVRDAVQYGPAPVQILDGNVTWIYPTPASMSEDCLSLNVWTPATHGKRPVLVWLYGGAFYTGFTGMALTDGAQLARAGDMVVVTINYRVGVLGGAAHPALTDERTGEFANWGLQDQIAGLEWVQANIGAFGGDPSKVTVIGQSAGASTAAIFGQNPRTAHLFRSQVLLSMAYIAPPGQASAPDQATYMNAFAASLNTNVAGLRQIPADQLFGAEAAFSHRYTQTATGQGRYRWPILDNKTMSAWPSTQPFTKPTMMGFCRNEGAFGQDLYDTLQKKQLAGPPPSDPAAVRAAAQGLIAHNYFQLPGKPEPAAVFDAFLAGIRADGSSSAPADTLLALATDVSYRHNGVRMAERSAADGNRSVYLWDFALPLVAPARGTPHTSDIAFWFGSYADPFYAPKFGVGPYQQQLSHTMQSALISFVHTGKPAGAGVPHWPALTGQGTPDVLHLGADGKAPHVAPINDYSRLKALDPVYFS